VKRVGYIGGFGHWPNVAAEFKGLATVQTVGAAPAFEGEDLSALLTHAAMPADLAVFGSIVELLGETQPDAVVVSTRPDHIARTAVRVAEAGCDLICEKPLGLTLLELKAVRDAVRSSGVRLLPMLSMRTDPVFMKARELYQAGAIGESVLINVRKSYRFAERPEWFGDRLKYGGTWPWVGIHAVDMIWFITGSGFVSVSARHRNAAHSTWRDCEDGCAGLFELNHGAFATVSVDLLRPEQAPTHGDDWIRIAGTEGVLEARSNEGTLRLINEGGEVAIPVDSGPIAFYAEILKEERSEFFEAIMDDGFLLTEAVLCARESADQNGLPVKTGH